MHKYGFDIYTEFMAIFDIQTVRINLNLYLIKSDMKKRLSIYTLLLFFLVTFPTLTLAEEKSKWQEAGNEISEAATAVGDASKESWEKTKKASSKMWNQAAKTTGNIADKSTEKGGEAVDATVETSKSFWSKVKSTTSSWYKSAKNKIHQLTAPSSEKSAEKNN